MKLNRYIIGLIGVLSLTFSCEKWLDVSPKTEVKESDLFSKESGYKTALLGQYISMSKTTLYGGNLTMGFLDALAQYYSISSKENDLYYAQMYDYEEKEMKSTIAGIWSSMYEIVANLNNILYNMEQNRGLFSDVNYNIIKGEALGLRAYIHLDLLRLFSCSFAEDANRLAIPYVDKLTNVPFPQLTNKQVVERIVQDLKKAEELLVNVDPFGPAFPKYQDSGNSTEYEADNGFLDYRRERMNYYAVTATLARAYLYAGDKENANLYALKTTKTSRALPSSVVFQLYSSRLTTYSDRYFNSKLSADKQLIIPEERNEGFYETALYGSVDERLKTWFNYYPNSNVKFVSKYMKLPDAEPENIALVRGAEAYYIVSETSDTLKHQVKYLNSVRNSYGISTTYDIQENADLDTELYKEYRKTFVAEGQLFYYMKRKNFKIIEFAEKGAEFPKSFTLPISDTEKEFGNISKK